MAKKKQNRRSNKMTIPIALAVPLALKGIEIGNMIMDKDYLGARSRLTGVDYNGVFHFDGLLAQWTPTVIGLGVHMAASRFGVNSALGRARVPIIRV